MKRPHQSRTKVPSHFNRLNGTIKRKDIIDAVEKFRLSRKLATIAPIPNTHDLPNCLLSLPPDIRNQVYALAFNLGSVAGAGMRVNTLRNNPFIPHCNTNILQLCRQITLEARSLIEVSDTAYIPIVASMDFTGVVSGTNQHGIEVLQPTQSTILNALISFRGIHIHLHTTYRPSIDPEDEASYLDPLTSKIYDTLRQALLIVTCTPAFRFTASEVTGIRRHCVVHFDHYFSYW